MGKITTLAITEDEYRLIIKTLESGYTSTCIDNDGRTYYIIHRPNYRVAFALKLEYSTGLRISDIVKLRKADIVKDGERYRLDIIEKKTKKKRTFKINRAIYNAIEDYCSEQDIVSTAPIIGGTPYSIQKQLKYVREYLGIDRCSTHSFRKSAAMRVYLNTGKDIVATQLFLQHSSSAVTAKYLTTCNTILDNALDKMVI